jgi:hypothetical protein
MTDLRQLAQTIVSEVDGMSPDFAIALVELRLRVVFAEGEINALTETAASPALARELRAA